MSHMTGSQNGQESSPVVSIRMTRQQRATLDKAAAEAGVSRAAFIRRGIGYALGMADYVVSVITAEAIEAEIARLEAETKQEET